MSAERPNVLCIVADDLGWRDLGCYGSPFYETPTLDALAREGTRFTDAYAAAPVCSPTRASLMTGQYPARVGVTDWIDCGGTTHPMRGRVVDAEYCTRLPDDRPTLPERLREGGYATWHVGKWHLGGLGGDSLPGDHGFDVNVGGCEWGKPNGPDGYFAPWEIPTLADRPDEDGRYLPDRLSETAVGLIEDHAGRDEPFFLNYNPYLVHTPIQAPSALVENYEQKRAALGLDDRREFEVGDRMPTESKCDERIERRLVQSDPIYAAMVEWLDRSVARLLEGLEQTGQASETIVVFTSDNGGLATAEGSPTTNRPLAEGKGWMDEGGNRVPLLVRWPSVTDADDAPDVIDTPVTTPDLFPTLLSAVDRSGPSEYPVDGVSLEPLLVGESLDRNAVFWHYPHYGNQGATPAGAVRSGGWKLVEYFETGHVELYDLATDISEDRDRSGDHPETAKHLHTRLREWRDEVGAVLPEPNPEYEPWPDRAGPD